VDKTWVGPYESAGYPGEKGVGISVATSGVRKNANRTRRAYWRSTERETLKELVAKGEIVLDLDGAAEAT